MEASVCFLGFPEDVMSLVLLGVVVLASIGLSYCVLARYVGAWHEADDHAPDPNRTHDARMSLFTSNWFFLLDALLCLFALLGLIVCL